MFFWTFLCALYISYCNCQETFEVDIYGESQHGYYITVYMGSPAQEINLLLDTGSSNIAVAVVPPTPGDVRYFHANRSTTLKRLNIAVDLHYIAGRWKGFLAEEVMDFGKGDMKFTVACMESIDEIFEPNSKFHGLLGLGYPAIALPNPSVEPFFDTLTNTQNIDNIYTLDLCGPYFTSKLQKTTCGKFEMGYNAKEIDSYHIMYTPIVKEWYYEIILTDLKIGTKHVPVKCWELNKDKSAIDSGTTALFLPKAVYDWTIAEIRKQVHHIILDKYWMNETAACIPYDKFDIASFPTLSLTFYHTTNSTFNLLVSPELYLLPFNVDTTLFTCFKLAFEVLDNGVLIGSSILKGFFVVFDRENKRIGFANSKHFNKTNGFPGSVTKPKYTNQNIELCKNVYESDSYDLSPLMIVVLFTAVMVTLILLYMLVSWIFKHFFMHAGESSETSSLVDGIVLETWKD
ncbi:beta-secretase 1 [Trichonephila clavata]|uniref:Beta-secretase 1 n=1 Tax=Trichonephila clavata TaxID=2740835 RepID=A0A8X6G734_TRICU|nr:beta-secretase 1 [Trichonephila clavata]